MCVHLIELKGESITTMDSCAFFRMDGRQKMGATILEFKPRESLADFVKNKTMVSLIRRSGGRKSSKNMVIHGENLAALAEG